MGASLIVLDATLSITTPAKIWLSTGVRAIDHCVEGICSLEATKDSDDSATKGLRMLVPSLLETKGNWEAREPREQSMRGVVHAMKAVGAGVPMGASHGVGHQLGPLGVGHGETSCIMLAAVLKWSWKHGDDNVKAKQKKVLNVLWDEEVVAKILESRGLEREGDKAADAGDVVDAVVRELGMPRSLGDVGVGKEKWDDLAENSLKDPWLKTNPVPVTEKSQVLEILEMVA